MERMGMRLGFKKLVPTATIPVYTKTDTDAGLDLSSAFAYVIQPAHFAIVDTGIAWNASELLTELEKPAMFVKSRSGLAFNSHVEASAAGVVDATFTGSIKVKLYNYGDKPFTINTGDRIAQGVVFMLPNIIPYEVEELPETDRGGDGIGSTGI